MKTPKSIRGKVSLATTLITAIAMVLIVAATAFATYTVLTRSIATTMDGHLDTLQAELEAGAQTLSIEGTGAELIQVIDESGVVIASSDWAKGYDAISAGGLEPGEVHSHREKDPILSRHDDDDDDDDGDDDDDSDYDDDSGYHSSSSGSSGSTSGGSSSGGQSSSKNPTNDDDDDDDSGSSDYDSGASDYESDDDSDDRDYDSDDDDSDDYDYDSGSDYDDDSDDDDDSRMARASSDSIDSHNGKSLVTAALSAFTPSVAYAAEADAAAAPAADEVSVSGASALGSDGPFLIVERGVETPTGPVTIAAMTSLAFAVEAAMVVASFLGLVMLISLVLVGGFSWYMASRTLRPVETMRQRVEDISSSNLSARIPVPDGDLDLSRLAVTFNEMIGRVEAAMDEQHRFISDASHELKSPIAATSIMLETMRDYPDAVDHETLAKDLTAENERMRDIVSNLLLLAQADEGAACLDKHPIDLYDLLFEEIAAMKARSGRTVDVRDLEPVVCTADATDIRHAFRNLLENADRYAQSKVKVTCRTVGDMVHIVVSDDGPGIPEADRERIFGRFVRLEEGRSRKQGSTGLGLAVVRSIAERHGGTARFVDPELGGATAVLSIKA